MNDTPKCEECKNVGGFGLNCWAKKGKFISTLMERKQGTWAIPVELIKEYNAHVRYLNGGPF